LALPYAQSQDNESKIELAATIAGSPLIPSTSQIMIRVPLGIMLDQKAFSKVSANAWYMAATPYLVPGVFFEIGATLDYGFGRPSVHGYPLSLSLGSAFSMKDNIISIPAIVGISSNLKFIMNSSLNPGLMILIYGEGAIAHAKVSTKFAPFSSPLTLVLGAEGMVAASIAASQSMISYGFVAGLSYSIGANK